MGKTNVIATIAVNTTLSAVVAALTAGVVAYIHRRCFEPETMSMGTLSGLVSITASAPVVAPHTAAAIGSVLCAWDCACECACAAGRQRIRMCGTLPACAVFR